MVLMLLNYIDQDKLDLDHLGQDHPDHLDRR